MPFSVPPAPDGIENGPESICAVSVVRDILVYVTILVWYFVGNFVYSIYVYM